MRQAKSLHGPVVSSFKNCEMWIISPIIDSIPYLNIKKLINKNVSRELLVREFDQRFYYGLIGRNTNFRYYDASSIWHYKDPKKYLRRAFSKKEHEILETYFKNPKEKFVLCTHEALANPEPIFSALNKVKVIWARRHPVYVCDSWLRKQWPERIGKDPISLTLAFQKKNSYLPWYLIDEKINIKKLNLTEKIILSYRNLLKLEKKNFLKYKKKYSINPMFFEICVTNKKKYVQKLEKITGEKKTNFTNKILKHQKVPRKLDYKNFISKKNNIFNNVSSKYKKMFIGLIKEYEKDFYKQEKISFEKIINKS